jgi:hypothetical protein
MSARVGECRLVLFLSPAHACHAHDGSDENIRMNRAESSVVFVLSSYVLPSHACSDIVRLYFVFI